MKQELEINGTLPPCFLKQITIKKEGKSWEFKVKNGHFILTGDNTLMLGNSKVRIFKPAILAMFPCENDEDLCHRISFQTMKEVIGFAFDPSIENPFTVLKNLRDLVMIHKVWNEVTRQIEY